MKRVFFISLLAMLLLAACGGTTADSQDASSEVVTIYKSPT